MTNKKNYSSFKTRFLTSKAVLAGVCIILGLISISLGKEVYRSYQINKEISSIKDEISGLQQKNDELSHLLEYFKTDAYQEKEAREKLNLQKAGETAIAIPTAKPNDADQDKIKEAEQKDAHPNQSKSNSSKWWDYFFLNKHN